MDGWMDRSRQKDRQRDGGLKGWRNGQTDRGIYLIKLQIKSGVSQIHSNVGDVEVKYGTEPVFF